MEVDTYQAILSTIKSFRGLSKDCLVVLERDYPHLPQDTLRSILSTEYQKRMRVNHTKSQANYKRYWELYQQAVKEGEKPGIIVRMAVKFDICPCLIAKMILQKFLDNQESQVNDYMRDTTLIPDMHLAYEVFLCTLSDNLYSPFADAIKHSIGQQYEIKLHNEIVKLGLAFYDEERLRKYGYDKTPDVKLDIPIAVDGFIVNWIESKALFGDDELHRDYTRNQYLSYWNRFGPGLVIYWFGYPKSIVESGERRFIIRDCLPANIVQLGDFQAK